jgi:xylan 1,4-beta-xylosidase
MEEQIIIDARSPAKAFPHFWEHMFGSCHASVTLCEDWRKDLRALREIVDVKYVRFHGIFEHQAGIYGGQDSEGNLVLNFTRINLIYDGLLEIGVAPFVELGFMPEELAVRPSPHPFWYHPNVSPPHDPRQWYELIFQFARHLVERYGIEQVADWYFEVWNEPNINFWTGEPKEETYYDLYDVTASALKAVNPRLRVGGPATAQAAWVDRFIRHCVEKNVPVDFVSTHIYPNDTAQNVFGKEESIPQSEMVALAVRKVYQQVQASARPELPIIWTEYNAGFDGVQLDSPYVGAWLANNIRLCTGGLATEMSYWTFTDAFFEEDGVFKSVFQSGFGLIATGRIPKASFNAFKILHYLGDEQLALDSTSALLTRRSNDGRLVVALWNYVLPRESGQSKDLHLQLKGFKGFPERARIFLVDDDHGSPLKSWQAMGSPDFPSLEEQAALRKAAVLPPPLTIKLPDGRLSVSLLPNALAVIEFF